MRTILWAALASALLGAAGCAATVAVPARQHPARAAVEISSFHDALALSGDWLQVEPWGQVWTPWDVEPGWRPYTHGHWAASAFGWTWVSDEPWGWAPFHYGRWTYHAQYGWLWIPDTVWAPAWVAWRAGNNWVGWAPLPPEAQWRAGTGLEIHGPDLSLTIVQHGWSFVRQRDFLEPRIWRSLEPLPRHRYLLRETRDRTHYEEVDGRIAGRGISLEEIEHRAGPVRRYRIEDLEKVPSRGASGARRALPVQSEEQEQQRLTAWEQQQRESLDDEQKRERRDWLPGQVAKEILRRQEEERRALVKEVERERQLAASRRDRRARERAKEKGKPQPL